MGIKTLYDTGSSNPIPVEADGAVYSLIGGDCVIDCGSKFNINRSSSTRSYSFPVGDIALIGGAFFKIDSSAQSFTLNANATNYLALRINASASGTKGSIVSLSSIESAKHDNLYDITSGTRQRDLILYKYTTNSSGVTSLEDLRVIRSQSSTSYSGYGQWVGTRSEYNAISTKSNNTIYFVTE